MYKNIHVHYFSGTGNSQKIAFSLAENFRKCGSEVIISNMEMGTGEASSKSDLHLFVFPVLGFSTPHYVLQYVLKMEKVKGVKAAVVFTAGGYAGFAHVQIEWMLRKKGFDVVWNSLVACPDNWTQMVEPMPKAKALVVLTEAEKTVPAIVNDIMEGKVKKEKIANFQGAISFIVNFLFSRIGRFMMGMCYIADTKCNECGLCVSTCPTENIRYMKLFSKKLYWGWNCEDCNRCINICPQKAIQVSWLLLAFHGTFQVVGVLFLVKFFLHGVSGLGFVTASWSWIINLLCFFSGVVALVVLEGTLFNRFLFLLHQIPFVRKLSTWTWTVKSRRYTAPGFKPLRRNRQS